MIHQHRDAILKFFIPVCQWLTLEGKAQAHIVHDEKPLFRRVSERWKERTGLQMLRDQRFV